MRRHRKSRTSAEAGTSGPPITGDWLIDTEGRQHLSGHAVAVVIPQASGCFGWRVETADRTVASVAPTAEMARAAALVALRPAAPAQEPPRRRTAEEATLEHQAAIASARLAADSAEADLVAAVREAVALGLPRKRAAKLSRSKLRRPERGLRRGRRVIAVAALVLALVGSAAVVDAQGKPANLSNMCGTSETWSPDTIDGDDKLTIVGETCAREVGAWLGSVVTWLTGLVAAEEAKHSVADKWFAYYDGRRGALQAAKDAEEAKAEAARAVDGAHGQIDTIVAKRSALCTAQSTTATKVAAAQAARDAAEVLEQWFTDNTVTLPSLATAPTTNDDPTS